MLHSKVCCLPEDGERKFCKGNCIINSMVLLNRNTLKDFIERLTGTVNKRAIENFIKAGALDCLEGNRRQKMVVYSQIVDSIAQEKKNSFAGQMSLFDLVSDEEKKEYEIRMQCTYTAAVLQAQYSY